MSFSIDSVKISLGEEIRRFPMNGKEMKLVSLMDYAKSLFGIGNQLFVLKYRDEENDLISITTEMELLEAIRLQEKKMNKSSVFRLFVVIPTFPANVATSSLQQPEQQIGNFNEQKNYSSSASSNTWEKNSQQDNKKQWKKETNSWKKEFKHQRQVWKKIDLSASVIKEDNVKVSHIGGTCFVKTWRVRNDGNSVWPANSRIELKKGDPLFATSSSFVFATKEIAIGEEIDISIPLKAPMQPGKYVAVWKLTVDNQGTWSKHFGHSLKIKIYVQDANGNLVYNKKEYKRKDKKKDYKKKKDKPTWGQYLQQFDQLGFTNKKTNILLLKKNSW